jgi:hypothetical protein
MKFRILDVLKCLNFLSKNECLICTLKYKFRGCATETIRNPKAPEDSEKFTEPIRYFGFTVSICKTFRFQSVNFCSLR